MALRHKSGQREAPFPHVAAGGLARDVAVLPPVQSEAAIAVSAALESLGLQRYAEALTAEGVAESLPRSDRDALRASLKAHGVSKLGHREKLLGALHREAACAGDGAPSRLGEINVS